MPVFYGIVNCGILSCSYVPLMSSGKSYPWLILIVSVYLYTDTLENDSKTQSCKRILYFKFIRNSAHKIIDFLACFVLLFYTYSLNILKSTKTKVRSSFRNNYKWKQIHFWTWLTIGFQRFDYILNWNIQMTQEETHNELPHRH